MTRFSKLALLAAASAGVAEANLCYDLTQAKCTEKDANGALTEKSGDDLIECLLPHIEPNSTDETTKTCATWVQAHKECKEELEKGLCQPHTPETLLCLHSWTSRDQITSDSCKAFLDLQDKEKEKKDEEIRQKMLAEEAEREKNMTPEERKKLEKKKKKDAQKKAEKEKKRRKIREEAAQRLRDESKPKKEKSKGGKKTKGKKEEL